MLRDWPVLPESSIGSHGQGNPCRSPLGTFSSRRGGAGRKERRGSREASTDPHPQGKSWSNEEARAVLKAAHDGDDYLYAAYVLVLVLGLRKGEVLGLTWEHIEWDG